jgi:COP9 signalosome complex subunit 5
MAHSFVISFFPTTGNPIEVMGLLMGRPDTQTPNTLIITDAFPLPIEGFETRVVADDEHVVNHMISLGESLETTRKEKFMGWYHSHPFDLSEHSHCFLSQTDLTTQLQWQRAEDPHGNPFVALVVDPLRSMNTEYPEIKAFRAYPPEYNSPVANECPNGSIETSDQIRLEKWGSCWNRYYELKVEYYMSSVSRKVIVDGLTQDSLWMRSLVRAPPSLLLHNIKSIANDFVHAANAEMVGSAGGGGRPAMGNRSSVRPDPPQSQEWNKLVTQVSDLAMEQLAQETLQESKNIVFGVGL